MKTLKVLHISSFDLNSSQFNGFAWLDELLNHGISANLLVLNRQSSDPRVGLISSSIIRINKFTKAFRKLKNSRGFLVGFLPWANDIFKHRFYIEAEIVHLHIILDGTLDSRTIRRIMSEKKVIWTWHDPSPTTGHCVTPMDCSNWRRNCQNCPDLERPFPVTIDRGSKEISIKQSLAHSVDLIHVSSNWMQNLIRSNSSFELENLVRIPFGVDTKHYFPEQLNYLRLKYAIPEGDFVIGFRQTSDVYKNMDFIKRALTLQKNLLPLTIMTIGDLHLIDEINLLGGHRIVELPWTNDDRILRNYYNSLNLFLSPSRFESFGFMGLEAMACGTKVVGITGSAVAEICDLSNLGHQVQDGDCLALLEIIEMERKLFCTNHPNDELFEYVKSNYSIEKFINKLSSVYLGMVR
jgi:glycosyltransferase involved in cell wall biosynthesis